MSDLPVDDTDPSLSESRLSPPQAGLRVTTGSRLHFGLLDTAAPFGGVGVMIDQPATEIVVAPDKTFRCDDEAASRVRAVALRVAEAAGLPHLPACQVTVAARPPAHSGLGSGTQLAMATAEALCRFVKLEVDPVKLARVIAARGERSAVGIHGYFKGGLIYESADSDGDLNAVRRRIELPIEWCVALFRPQQSTALISGDAEREQFSRLSPSDSNTRSELRSIVEQQMMPAAQTKNFASFANAVATYNHQSGLLFQSVQGGAYNGEAVTELIEQLVDRGANGVGQSSWGPSVFAWFESGEEANDFIKDLPADFAKSSVTTPRNQGRTWS